MNPIYSPEKHFAVLEHLQKETKYGINPDLVVFWERELSDTPVQALLSLRLTQAKKMKSTKVADQAFHKYINGSLEKRNSREFIDQTLWGTNLSDEESFSIATHLDALLREGTFLAEIQDPLCSDRMVKDIDTFCSGFPNFNAVLVEEQIPAATALEKDLTLLREQFLTKNFLKAKETIANVTEKLKSP